MPAIEQAIAADVAGSPVKEGVLWTNRSATDLAEELQEQGFQVGADTVRRILSEDLGLSRRQAIKDETGCHFPNRDEQFRHIAELRREFEARGWPILSIDTKKKEILGNFWHPGRAYTHGRVVVEDHDFVRAEDRLVPFGVFDTRRNEGFMLLARGADTCELACDAIWRWWKRMGERRYRDAPRLLLLCDCGGSNGNRQHVFKEELCYLASDMDCDIRVAHYPPGCSKYNPIEHRMFCHVTRSLQAAVLKTIEIAKHFIARTKTAQGLRVIPELARRMYEKGLKASELFLTHNPIRFESFLPQLNYTAPSISRLLLELEGK